VSTARFDFGLGVPPARDLGSIELWEVSLARSRQRRRLTELGRRARRRRKSASLAASAALVAGPVLPRATVAAAGSGDASPGSSNTHSRGMPRVPGSRVLLRMGSEGGLVAAAQRRLNEVLPPRNLAVDGILGPLTRAAIVDFQLRHRLAASGMIDTRTWAVLFDAPVLVLAPADGAASAAGGSGAAAGAGSQPGAPASARHRDSASAGPHGTAGGGGSGAGPRSARAGSRGVTGNANSSGAAVRAPSASAGGPAVSVVAPSAPSTKPATYVLADGVALPLPRNYLVNGYVDQGVDYAAPGGTPLYAMGDGVITGEGISGFGPNTPILQITSGPLKGMEIYYGHAGVDSVRVGARVRAGQQISEVGYGVVGISTGPHLEVGFYPPGPSGSGSRMLTLVDHLLSQHPNGRTWGTTMAGARTSAPARSTLTQRAVARAPRAPAIARRPTAAEQPKGATGRLAASGLKRTRHAAVTATGSRRPTSEDTPPRTARAASRPDPISEVSMPSHTAGNREAASVGSSGEGTAGASSSPSAPDGRSSPSSPGPGRPSSGAGASARAQNDGSAGESNRSAGEVAGRNG
jgi:peptidoglycan hydrolase-like protein with peptidoglycan-binding domain